jgi:hypothetical protein
VDVRTAEGDDAGKMFVDILKGLGAKVRLPLLFLPRYPSPGLALASLIVCYRSSPLTQS